MVDLASIRIFLTTFREPMGNNIVFLHTSQDVNTIKYTTYHLMCTCSELSVNELSGGVDINHNHNSHHFCVGYLFLSHFRCVPLSVQISDYPRFPKAVGHAK